MQDLRAELEQLKLKLVYAAETGNNWVAFATDGNSSYDMDTFQYFESAQDADNFCTANSYKEDLDVFYQGSSLQLYQYTAIENLLSEIEHGRTITAVEEIERLLSKQDTTIHESALLSTDDQLIIGNIFPVVHQREIHPLNEIDRYHIVAHEHPGHQVYEVGHSSHIVATFDQLSEANEAFNNLIAVAIPDSHEFKDCLLIGQYRGRSLELNIEGYPLDHCGKTIRYAFAEKENSRHCKIYQENSLGDFTKPVTISQYLFAKYDAATAAFQFYNTHLKEVKPQAYNSAYYPDHYVNTNLITDKYKIMNVENYDYLKNQVKFTGFGDSLANEMKREIEKQAEKFQLNYSHAFGKDEINATLNFRKSDQQDMYFFNSYQVSVKPDGSDNAVQQTFYVGKENNFTLKEAYNLLCGRAVNKDLVNREQQGYNAWVQLDFKETENSGNYKLKHFTEHYGYDMAETLAKLPIKELNTEEAKSRLLESLQKGNRQSVTFLIDGAEQKRFIEANPQFKTVTVYDDSMKRIRLDQKVEVGNEQSVKKDQRKNQTEKTAQSEGKTPAEKKSRSRKHGVS